jgi:hypothetical protein
VPVHDWRDVASRIQPKNSVCENRNGSHQGTNAPKSAWCISFVFLAASAGFAPWREPACARQRFAHTFRPAGPIRPRRIRPTIVSVTVYAKEGIHRDREHALHLLDQLTPAQLAAVVHLMETMVPPDEDRDTLSNAESKTCAEADEWLKHHPPISISQRLMGYTLMPSSEL